MKICVIGLRGLPNVMGGVETHCAQLFPLLKERRPHDSFVVIGRSAYLRQRVAEYRGLRIVSLAHSKTRHFETITNSIYGALYARFRLHAELLHVHGIGPALVAPLARCLGMKVIVTYHSKNYEHDKWNWIAALMLRLGELFAVWFANAVIAVSQSLAADLKRRFPDAAHRIHFIPNGANHADGPNLTFRDADAILSRYGLTPNKYLIAVGRLVPEKGFHDLIDAFKKADLDCKLVIVGAANCSDEYLRYLLSQASDRMIFTGFLAHELVQRLLQSASLFVLPSYNEGLPIAALEAAAAGTPILVSDIEPNRDLGLRAQNYFAAGNVDDLRCKLMQDHKLYWVDRDDILRRYSWNEACAETDRLYSSLQTD
jgi:glycosyltransferase involved in cell wall biosynthesis